ncbi:helix-turn-helix DNA binding domain protein [Arthrobacter phage Ottawa]|nr:helix-turn-helix DNA binding domain protein [Arthrobacter phage Kharcho]WIC89291.1 helix-turn-helix DNA binding domain protein [Arthrobacter phage Ottawa]
MAQTPEELADVVQLTAMLRVKEREAQRIADRRRQAILRHRASTPEHPPVPYADLAEAMGMSQARLYKIIKGKADSVPRGARATRQHG